MAYKLKVRNKTYDLKDGFTIKEELNETLDSVERLEFKTFHEEFVGVPFDHAKIYDDENKITDKHFMIDTYDDEVYSFENGLENNNHSYILKLFSETKGLERITLPCMAITQPTDPNASKTMVRTVLLHIRSNYIPKYKHYRPDVGRKYAYAEKYDFDPDTLSMFANVVCPEFQWNYPTLREVLTDLFSTLDCIPVVRQGVISHYSLKETGSSIDTSKLTYSKRTMSSGDYVGELTLNMKNAIGKNKVTCCEYLSLRASEGSGTLTTENGVFRTMNPIYNIKKLIIHGFSKYHLGLVTKYYFHKVDEASRVKEYEDWNVLSNVKVSTLSGSAYQNLPEKMDANGITAKEHKVNYMYFERGKNEICNFSKSYNGHSFSNDVLVLTISRTMGNNEVFDSEPRRLFAYIEYETIAEHPINVGKYLPVAHPENRVFDAQKDSYVDAQHQSIFEYAKVERLGNKIREIYGEYFSESDIPSLGDCIGDEVLFSKEVTYFDNIILFKGYLTPNYVLRDYFTGVMAKKRSWEIAKGSEALTRHDVYKAYVEASFSEKKDNFSTYIAPFDYIKRIEDDNVMYLLLSAFIGYGTDGDIRHALVRTKHGIPSEYYPSSTEGIITDVSTNVEGRSLCFTFGFNDNFKSADYIVKDDGEYTQNFYKYCRSTTGQFANATIWLLKKTWGMGDGMDMPIAKEDDPDDEGYIEDEYNEVTDCNYERPLMTETNALKYNDGFEIQTSVNKDNREIIKWTIQLEYCSDTKDIIVTKRVIELCSLYNENSHGVNTGLRLALSKTPYGIKEEKIHSDSTLFTFGVDSLYLYHYFNSSNDYMIHIYWDSIAAIDALTYASWAICDTDGNILLAVNANYPRRVIFNLLRSRDTNVYLNSYSDEVVGNIADIDHIGQN